MKSDILDLLSKLDGIIGYQGQLLQNKFSLSLGEMAREQDQYFFGISRDHCVFYPQKAVTDQNAMLIELLLQQYFSQYQPLMNAELVFRKIIEGKEQVPYEMLRSVGLDPKEGYIPMIISLCEPSSLWKDAFYSYFSRDAVGVALEEYFYALIPIRSLAIDPASRMELEDLGRGFAGLLVEEGIESSAMAFAEPVHEALEWTCAFTKAKMAYFTGSAFYPETNVYFYWGLKLENLLFNTAQDTAENFIVEILGMRWINEFDTEIYKTVSTLIDENFNLSEAARKLFIHRNTLLYRLERVKDETGKDLRISKDALQVYLAMLLSKRHTN